MYVNRTVAIVSLKPPFLTWLNSNASEQDQLTIDELGECSHVVLLPDETLDDDETTIEVVNQYWLKIAQHVFNEWDTDRALWPKNFSADDFEEWFDLAIIDSAVGDLVDDELISEEAEVEEEEN